ncbi:MAG: hypothetical protein H3C34_24135, partial [Caldilineaceae bacterium]|nr:hypothetical protein [Caldilineaceae bacterium]
APGEPKHGGILTYGLVGDPPSLDPHIQKGAADATVKNMVYSRLITWDRSMHLAPELAESWTVVDDTTIQFKLREGVKFHNGAELTADDVVFSFQRIQDPDLGASAAGSFVGMTFEALDPYTVQVKLEAPNAAIFQNMARTDALIVSKEWVEGGADVNQEMMGTGPFKYVGREPNVSFEVERFDDYFRAPLPYLDGIKFVPYSDETAKSTAIRTGEIDFIDYVPWIDMDEIERLANEGQLKFYSDKEALFMTLYMNGSEPPFNNKLVRQAVSWAIDREAVGLSIFFGRGKPMTGSFIPESFLGYDPSLDGTYGYDPEKAKALLDEAGWRDEDGDGILEAHGVDGVEDGTPFKVNFLATNLYAMHYNLAELAQANLKEIGIDGTVELVDWPSRTQRRLDVIPWEIQADGLGQSVTDPSFMDVYYHSTRGQWPPRVHFGYPEVDEKLDAALATYDEAERARLYNEVDQQMLDEVNFVYVWRREQGEAMQPYVMNFSHIFGVNSFLMLPEVWLDQ